jgi:tagatose 6-phosphate kinase
VKAIVDAQNQPLLKSLEAGPLLVKPNRSELLAAMKDGTSWQSAAKKMVEIGTVWALITMGKEGSALTDGREFWSIKMPSMDVISPIGSGDAYAAGIAAGIVRGMSMLDAARLGCACATANALIPVAGHLHLEDVQRLLPQVIVKKM